MHTQTRYCKRRDAFADQDAARSLGEQWIHRTQGEPERHFANNQAATGAVTHPVNHAANVFNAIVELDVLIFKPRAQGIPEHDDLRVIFLGTYLRSQRNNVSVSNNQTGSRLRSSTSSFEAQSCRNRSRSQIVSVRLKTCHCQERLPGISGEVLTHPRHKAVTCFSLPAHTLHWRRCSVHRLQYLQPLFFWVVVNTLVPGTDLNFVFHARRLMWQVSCTNIS